MPTLRGPEFSVDVDKHDRVSWSSVSMEGGDRDAVRAELVARWGEPVARVGLSGGANTADVWVNPEAHVRTLLWANDAPVILAFEPYLPLAELIGNDPTRLGFERIPVLGASRDELARAFGDAYARGTRNDTIALPPRERTEMHGSDSAYLEFDADA